MSKNFHKAVAGFCAVQENYFYGITLYATTHTRSYIYVGLEVYGGGQVKKEEYSSSNWMRNV